jgi:histidinol dehydrogenase
VRRFDWSDRDSRAAALARPQARENDALVAGVRDIIEDVRTGGWAALVEQSRRIDGFAPRRLPVAPFARVAREMIPVATQDAMQLAAKNIESFHRQTLPKDVEVLTYPGLAVSKLWRPLDRAGLYVPGGRAPLFSTLMMLAIPAKVAGVRDLVVVTPPRPDCTLHPAIALAAELCGVEAIWTVGGAQAIAALAFGAGDIPAVDRICGPGNSWVAVAKAQVAAMRGGPGIDLPAGPSELLVIADRSADAATVAADLLSQAEHDPDAQVLLVSPFAEALDAVEAAFAAQSARLATMIAPLRSIACADIGDAVAIANAYAPEHLCLAVSNASSLLPSIRNAGAVFVGGSAAESFGDYLAGSSHVLPTDGAARFTGGVSTLTFMKAMTVQQLSSQAAASLAAPAAALARLEGLEAHALAAQARAAS